MTDTPKKKIGINASMLDEHPTGVGVYTYNIINTLSYLYKKTNEHRIVVFSPTTRFLNSDVEVIKISKLLRSSQYGKLAAITRFLWNTFQYPFLAKKFDLLLSPTTHASFTLANQVITIHDLLSLRYGNISLHQRFYFKYLLPLLVYKAKLVITISQATKQDIIKYLNCREDKVHVVYNGYDHQQYKPVKESETNILKSYGVKNYLLAVGPTYPHKNFELLIKVYQRFNDDYKEKHPLVIAGGKKNYLDQLKALVKQSAHESHIHFLGYVPVELMPSLYREALLLVFPSLYEGFGFPLLEAMACGCPVVVSNTSSMPEVCGDAAIYFEPKDEESLFKALNKMIGNETIRQDMKIQGLKQATKFSWENTGNQLKKILDEVIS